MTRPLALALALALIFLLISLPFSLATLAQSELLDESGETLNLELTVRQLPNAHYEAVITYGSGNSFGLQVNPPSSVQMDSTNILIESAYSKPGPTIGTPPPPIFLIEQTADLGDLAAGDYTVTWIQTGNFTRTTTFEVSGFPPEPRSSSNPYPEAGVWYNPDESGTGFDLEFQGGIMAGHYFGYDANGQPEWYLVSNSLKTSQTPGVMWELEVEPERYTDGNCLGCAYQQPNDPELLDPIKIEFLERAQAKLTLRDGSIQYMVPIIYGDANTPVATDHLTQNLPAFASGSSRWVVVFDEYDEEDQTASMSDSVVLRISAPEAADTGPNAGKLVYSFNRNMGYIICEQIEDPVCSLHIHGKTAFAIPIGNFTDSRFFGNAANGDTVQGFRLNYD